MQIVSFSLPQSLMVKQSPQTNFTHNTLSTMYSCFFCVQQLVIHNPLQSQMVQITYTERKLVISLKSQINMLPKSGSVHNPSHYGEYKMPGVQNQTNIGLVMHTHLFCSVCMTYRVKLVRNLLSIKKKKNQQKRKERKGQSIFSHSSKENADQQHTN